MVNVILSFKHSRALELRYIIINMKEVGFVMLFMVRYFILDLM